MIRTALVSSALVTTLLAHAAGPMQAMSQATARPQGWDGRTHGDSAAADYDRLFSLDRVHELHIVMSADNQRRMQEDLASVVPMAGLMGRGRAGTPPPTSSQPGAGGPPGPGVLGRGWSPTTGDPEYVPVTVRHDGRVWTQVGMRYKGSFSLMMGTITGRGKMSVRWNFDRTEDTHPEVATPSF